MPERVPPAILIVDDDHDGRHAIATLLELNGYLPIGCDTSRRGLEYLGLGLRPCAILLDLLVPGDGWHFRAEQMANHHLLKPMDLDALLALVACYCPGRRPAA